MLWYLSALLMCDSICCKYRIGLNLLSSGFYTLIVTWSTCNTEPEQITTPSSFLKSIILPPSTKIMRPRIISTNKQKLHRYQNAYLSYNKLKIHTTFLVAILVYKNATNKMKSNKNVNSRNVSISFLKNSAVHSLCVQYTENNVTISSSKK